MRGIGRWSRSVGFGCAINHHDILTPSVHPAATEDHGCEEAIIPRQKHSEVAPELSCRSRSRCRNTSSSSCRLVELPLVTGAVVFLLTAALTGSLSVDRIARRGTFAPDTRVVVTPRLVRLLGGGRRGHAWLVLRQRQWTSQQCNRRVERGIMISSALEQRRMKSGGHKKRNYGGSASLKRTESKL